MSFRSYLARRLTFANCTALLALFIALGGVAFAASLPKNSVGSKQIKDSQIQSRDIKNGQVAGVDIKDNSLTSSDYATGTVQGTDVKDGTIASADITDATITGADVTDNSLTGTDIDESTLGAVPTVTGLTAVPRKLITATDGVDAATALAAAPEITLLTVGDITLTAKCYHDTTADEVYAVPYIKTAVNGVLFESNSDSKRGGPLATDFLNTDTLAADRELEDIVGQGNDNSDFSADDNIYFGAMVPSGTNITGALMVGARNGVAPAGTPITVEHGCVFGGHVVSV